MHSLQQSARNQCSIEPSACDHAALANESQHVCVLCCFTYTCNCWDEQGHHELQKLCMCVPYWYAISVSCIDPARRRNGDQSMAEVHKHINAAPLRQPVEV